MSQFQLYVKATSNCGGIGLTTFERLGPEWVGDSLLLPFGEGETRTLQVVGWTDLHGGSACPLHVVKVRQGDKVGFLVYGGNSGVRILDDSAESTPGIDEHLPPGYGMPIVWVTDQYDLPASVREVVTLSFADALTAELRQWQDEATWLISDIVTGMLSRAMTSADDLTDIKGLLTDREEPPLFDWEEEREELEEAID